MTLTTVAKDTLAAALEEMYDHDGARLTVVKLKASERMLIEALLNEGIRRGARAPHWIPGWAREPSDPWPNAEQVVVIQLRPAAPAGTPRIAPRAYRRARVWVALAATFAGSAAATWMLMHYWLATR